MVGRGTRMGHHHIPRVLSRRRGAQRGVARAGHGVFAGRHTVGELCSGVVDWFVGFRDRCGDDGTHEGAGIGQRTSQGQRGVRCGAARVGRSWFRCACCGDHRRRVVVGVASCSRSSACVRCRCAANGGASQTAGAGEPTHCVGHVAAVGEWYCCRTTWQGPRLRSNVARWHLHSVCRLPRCR